MKPDLFFSFLFFLDFLFRNPERPVSAEAPPWLIASLKSHKAVLTLTGCQSITAGPLLTVAETSREVEGRQAAGSGKKSGEWGGWGRGVG